MAGRIGIVAGIVLASLPALAVPASAAVGPGPVLTVSPATITYTDTSVNDSFTEVRGTASASATVSIVGGSNSLPNPPNTAVVFYTSGKVGTFGTLWLQDSGEWVYEPNIRAINGATTTVTDTFTFSATDGSGTGTQNLVVTVDGVEDSPALTVSTQTVSDITDNLPVTSDCTPWPGEGDPYQIEDGWSPWEEQCHLAFDNSTSTKYLNFNETPSSVLIDLKRAWTITSVGLTTANDYEERDPTAFDLYGSNISTTSGMTLIESVTDLSPPWGRFQDYSDTPISAGPAYRYLKLTFTNDREKNYCCVQISEIRLAGITGSNIYTEGDPPMVIEPTLLLTDDNTAGATVSITSGFTTGDVLSFTNDGSTMGTVSASWDAGTGELTFSGSATVAQWQNVLRAVKYSTTNVNPTVNSSTRTVTWSVTDSASLNTTATSTFPLVAINSAPVVGGASPLAVDAPSTTLIAPDLTVTDDDSDAMNRGVLTVSGATTGDVLAISSTTPEVVGAIRTNGSEIERYDGASWVTIGTAAGGVEDTYTVTFTSSAVTPAIAQAVARAVGITVDSTARTRTLSLTVSDGDGGTSSTVSIPTTSSTGVAASLSLKSTSDTGVSSSDRLTRATTLTFEVSFSGDISGLDPSDFSFDGSTATGCAATPSGNTAPVTVAVSGCGEGTVVLNLLAGAVQSAADPSKTNEAVSAPGVTVDRTAPTIALSATTASPTRSIAVSFALSAEETLDCATVTASDFTLTKISGIGAVTAGTNSCSFTGQSSVVMGSSSSSGIAASGAFGVADVAGNVAGAASGTPSVTVDRTVPEVTSATLDASSDTGESSSDGITKAASLNFTVSFSESVVGVDGTDFRNSGTAPNCAFSVSATSGTSVTVTADGCGAGTLVLTTKAESLSGANGDGPLSEHTADAVTIDRTAPTRSSLSPADGTTGVARGTNMVVGFNETVYRQSGNVVVFGPDETAYATIDITSADVTGTGTTSITVNPATDLGAGGNYYMNIDGTALADTAGNYYSGISDSTTWNFRTVDNLAPATSVDITATEVQSTAVSLAYTASEEGGLVSVDAWYSTSASLTSPVLCGTVSSSSLSGTVTCTIPDVLGTYYFYSRGTDSSGNVETAPGSADDSVALVDPLPVSSVTAPGLTRNRTVTVSWTASDNGSVASLRVYWSTAVNLSSPTLCATVNNPASSGSVACQLPSTQTTYYLYSRATDNRSQAEAAPGSADATVVYSNSKPVTEVTAPAATSTRTVTVGYTSSDDGTVASLQVYWSTAANLSSPTSCATVSNPSASGSTTCRLPVAPDTYYLFSRGTDDDGLIENAPASADATVTYTNARPTSAVTGPSTASARAVTLNYVADDNGTVAQLTVYYSTSVGLASPTSCGSKSNPGASGTVVCTLPNTSQVYYVWSIAVDDQDREESDPTAADVTIDLALPVTTPETTVVVNPATGGNGSGGVPGSPVVSTPPVTTIAPRRTPTTTTSTTTTTTTTTLPPTAGVPMVAAGEAAIVADGEARKASVTRENSSVRFQWNNLWAVIRALDKNGVPLGLDADGNIRVTPQSKVEVTASGFQPDSSAEAWVFSTPVRIGTALVGADGTTKGTYDLPRKLSAGSHRIVLTGLDAAGKPVKFALGITVVTPPKSASRTVLVVFILAGVGIALFIPPVRRRRSRRLS